MIGSYAQYSRLNGVSPLLKLWVVLILMAICVSANSYIIGVVMAALMFCLTVFVGGLSIYKYIRMLLFPLSFLMFSGLALLFEVTAHKNGVFSLPVAGYWLSVSEFSQVRAVLVISRALGALSCLYLFSLTTPISGIIGALRRIHCPGLMISLIYLIYRYILILLSIHHTMRDAATSRLGFATYCISICTTANIYSNLLMHSYRQAEINFDAMESRCYDSKIRFLEQTNKITIAHMTIAVAICAVTLGLSLWIR